MKIILINNLYKPYARGGAEKIVENTTKALLQNGHEVKIITTRPFFSYAPIYEKETNIYYLRSFYYHLGVIPKFLRFFWHIVDMFWPGDYIKTRSILKKEKPDVVITHNLKGIGLLASRAVRSSGAKYIHTLHDVQLLHPSGLVIYGEEDKINGFFSNIYAFLAKSVIADSDFVVSPSGWLMEMHNEKGFFEKSDKHVFPNPIDLSLGSSDVEKKENQYLYVGQIEDHKGVSFLLESFKKLPEDKYKLKIVGDGLLLEDLQKDAGENIEFLGRKNKEEVMKLMQESSCLIVPSLCYENSPTVIYEAFASGLPVLASRLGGITELLTPEFLFEAGNINDLTEKIKWFGENQSRIAEQVESNKRLAQELKTENYIKKIINLISS